MLFGHIDTPYHTRHLEYYTNNRPTCMSIGALLDFA